jgi:hypothetical protein
VAASRMVLRLPGRLVRVPALAPDVYPSGMSAPEWHSIDSPVTRGWWQLRRAGELLAQLQPYAGGAVVHVYPSDQPWKACQGPAGSVEQGKRHAVRWLRARGLLESS